MKERMKKSLALVVVAVFLLGVLSGCMLKDSAAKTANKIVQKVGSIEIKRSEFDVNLTMFKQQYEQMNQGTTVDWNVDAGGKPLIELANTEVMNALITNKVQLLMAEKNSIKVTDAEVTKQYNEVVKNYGGKDKFKTLLDGIKMTDAQFKTIINEQLTIDKLKVKLVGNLKATDAEALKYFNTNINNYSEIRAEHILVKTEAEALAIIKRLKAGEDFGKLALKLSTDTSAKTNKGDLGFFKKGAMVPEFEAAAFALKVNEISKPVQTQFGFHVIKLLAIKKVAFADHKTDIITQLNNEKQDKALKQMIAEFEKGVKKTAYPENLK